MAHPSVPKAGLSACLAAWLLGTAAGFAQTGPGSRLWEFPTDGFIQSTPAIGSDGTIYVSTEVGSVYILGPTQTNRFQAGGRFRASPAIGPDGTIYIGSSINNTFWTINPNATRKWQIQFADGIDASPAISVRAGNTNIYFTSYEGILYAIRDAGTTGAQKWQFRFGERLFPYSSPAIGGDGTIYVGSLDNNLYAIRDDETAPTMRWRFDSGADINSSPAIGADGRIYFGADNGKMFALRPDGTLKWEFVTEIPGLPEGETPVVRSSPAIGPDGTIYFGIGSDAFQFGRIYALQDNGTSVTRKWQFDTRDGIFSSPAVAADGMIYFGTRDGNIYGINSAGQVQWVFGFQSIIDRSSPAIGPDGTIYIGGLSERLVAIRGSAPLATSAWPKFRADSKQTGQVADVTPVPEISIFPASVSETAGQAIFAVRLSAAIDRTVTVNFSTSDDTARSGSDYNARSGTVTFPAMQINQTIAITILSDALDEPNERFFVTLSSPVNATLSSSQSVAEGIIVDDDLAAISISDVTISERDSGTVNVVFAVTLSSSSALVVSVDYATVDGTATVSGSDYVAASGRLDFPVGETQRTITVNVLGDTLNEPDETFLLRLSNAVNARLMNAEATGTILNDDVAIPAVTVSDTVTGESEGQAIFLVSLSRQPGAPVTFNYATADGSARAGSDYLATNGTLTFNPGGPLAQQVRVAILDDLLDEAEENFFLHVTAPGGGVTIADGQGEGFISDDDPSPGLVIDDVDIAEGNSGTTNAVFTVRLSSPSTHVVSVRFTTEDRTASDTNDFTAVQGVLVFEPGETNQAIAVAVNGDRLHEADEIFFVQLSSATNATIVDGQGVAIITNDDPAPVLAIDDVSVTEGNDGLTNLTFTVQLEAPSGQRVTAGFSSQDGSATFPGDYQAVTGTLTFEPGEISKRIEVLVRGDTLSEADEVFEVVLSNAVNASVGDGIGRGTIRDDDPLPALIISDANVIEGGVGATNRAVFLVSLSPASGQVVTVDYATADGRATSPADYFGTNGTLTFGPGETAKGITVLVNGDETREPDEFFFLNLTRPVQVTLIKNQAIGLILDDDEAAVSHPRFDPGSLAAPVGGPFRFRLLIAEPQTIVIEASADFTTWVALETNLVTVGAFDFEDWAVTNSFHRFYRVRVR